MATALGIESEIKSFLARIDLDAQRFCAICGPAVNYTKLTRALNDIQALDASQTVAARKTMRDLDILIRLCQPLPISLKNPSVIRDLLTKLENGQLKIDIHEE